MKDRFTQLIQEYICTHELLSRGDRVLIGLSGGADSVCLLLLLSALKEKYDLYIEACHVHHGIRGQEADQDAIFCRELAERYGVPFLEERVNVPEEAKISHRSEEEEGRYQRYASFEKIMAAHKLNKLALAHHENDLAETVLHNALRGSGVAGLASLKPKRILETSKTVLIRPLLGTTRREIEDYLEAEGICYRMDSTNASDDYLRNKIRHHLMPYLENEINQGAVRHLAELSDAADEVMSFVASEAARKLKIYVRYDDNPVTRCHISQAFFEKEDPAIISEGIRQVILDMAGTRKDISRCHIKMVTQLSGRQTGSCVNLPYGLKAGKTPDGLVLMMGKGMGDEDKLSETTLNIPGVTKVGSWEFTAEILENTGATYPKNRYTKWFDYDRMSCNPVIRSRQKGDYLVISAKGSHKSLSDYLINEKVPSYERDGIPMVALGQEICWVVGYRIGESAKVCEETKHIVSL
ncbi:MAG: tRNA lysidine(34) synthetase TilS, partial [Lachnospiraceae bacterium]|nr:tRNA lysidine(34) synthetase TilS [Candidatus Equihabitans merdae]